MLCALIVVGGTRVLGQIDLDVDDFLSEEPYAWANQTTYITGQLRIGNQFGCVSVDPMGMVREVNASTNEVPSQSRLQYRTRGVSGQLLWMLAVDSP